MKTILGLAVLLAPLTLAAAADKAPPLPPEVKQIVQAFTGTWKFEGTLTGLPGTTGPMKVKENIHCEKAAGGRVVSCTGKGTPGDYTDVAIASYDVNAKVVRFVAMDSEGAIHDHTCRWKDPATLACDPLAITAEGGQPATVDLTFTFPDKKSCVMVETTTLKDGSKIVGEFKGKR